MNRLICLSVLGGTLALPVSAGAVEHVYGIVIGNDAAPVDNDSLKPLRYADDDAARVYEWLSSFADESHLLTVLDSTSQERFARLASVGAPPTLDNLRRVVQRVRARVTADQERHDASTVFFYFSGHGSLPHDSAPASLALLDGPLTQQLLYDEVLAQLPGAYVHVLVDACHAEAVVRPRDASDVAPHTVTIDPEQASHWLANHTLARFPQVGALVASAADQESHEWDVYEGGIFTHELLSGLRGAADVNQDQRIEYSEIHAFLAAANRNVADRRMRLDIVSHPPLSDLRKALVDVRSYRDVAWLSGAFAHLRRFFLEDSRGVRILDANIEGSHVVALAVPANQTLYLKTADDETAINLSRGQRVSVDALSFSRQSMEVRDATVSALQRGLFATPFGPAYYRGFVDSTGDLPVEVWAPPTLATSWKYELLHKGPWIAAGASLVGAGVAGGFMIKSYGDWSHTNYQREASEAAQRYDAARTGVFVTVGAAALFSVLGLWSLETDDAPAP